MRIHSLNTWKTMACLLTMTLAACSADELIEMAGPDGTPVRVEHNDSESDMAVGFNISLAGSHRLNIGEDDADTRAANGVQATTFAYTTSAQSWSKVAIFWDKGDNNFTRADYTTKASSATPVGSGFYYATSSQTACHMYGWYPYVNQSHTIQMDQSSTVNYAMSDLLLTTAASASDVATSTRTKTNNVWSETKGTLNFKHVMTKFILKMTAGSDVTINKVELLSVKPTAAISITGGSGTAVSKIALAAASGKAAALTLFSTDNTVNDYTNKSGAAATKNKTAFTNGDGQVTLAAVIPPQSLSGNFIHVNTTAGDVYYTLGSTAKAFTGGQTYTVTFSVTQHEVGKTIDITNWNPSANTNVNIATANTLTMSKSVLVYDYNPTQQTVSNAVTKTAHTGVAPTSYVISKSGSSATGTINDSTGAVEIKYGGSNNAGTTTFTVTSKSGSTTLASYTFDVVVRKIKPTVTLGTPAMALAKKGSATSTVTVTGDGEVSVASSSDSNIATATKDGSNIKVTGKTTIGTCAINLKIDPSANYVGTTAAIAVSVGLSESTFSLNKTALTYTYGGANKTAKISGVTGSNSFSVASSNTDVATVSISGTTVTVTPVAVGTALITVTQAANNTYAASVKTIAVSVNKANNQITLGTQLQQVSLGSSTVTTPNIAVSNVRGTLSWDSPSSVTGITPQISGTNVNFKITTSVAAGTYTFILRDTPAAGSDYIQSTAAITIRVGVTGDTNTAGSSAIITVTRQATYTAPTAKSNLTYNKSAQQLVNAGSASGGTMYYKVDSGSWTTSVSSVTGTNAKDSYKVYYYVKGDGTHDDVGSESSPAGNVSVKIAKATPSVTAPTAKTLTYTGSAQALVNAGSTTGGTLKYSLTSGSSYGNSVPSETNAGSYTVYYKVVGGTNYNDVAEKSVAASIGKAAGTLSLSNTSMTLTAGGTGTSTITTNSTGAKTATSSNTAVATVAVSGSKVTVTGVGGGTATITVSVAGDSNHKAPSSKTISVTIGPTYFGSHEGVQLWDGGPYWATMNIGARTETDYGNYYAWGETNTKTSYSSSNYTYSGNPGTLNSSHDAATNYWGSDWRMPTNAEFEDLLDKTKRSWVTISGVTGYKFESKTDSSKYIFLPAGGWYEDTTRFQAGNFGNYWSSSIYDVDTSKACNMYFGETGPWTSTESRCYGQLVRPVHD